MELNERHISQLLDAVKSTADLAAATTSANKTTMEALGRLSSEVTEMRTQVALLMAAQQRHADEQREMAKRLFGEKDDGVIQRQNDRIEEIRLELATEIEENKRSGKRADGMMSVINGLFSMVSSFVMSRFGSH